MTSFSITVLILKSFIVQEGNYLSQFSLNFEIGDEKESLRSLDTHVVSVKFSEDNLFYIKHAFVFHVLSSIFHFYSWISVPLTTEIKNVEKN